MWWNWILLLCATGISSGSFADPRTNSINAPTFDQEKDGKEFGAVRRFACPVGFFRLKRSCYYLSAGMAPWRDAYFHCKDRNSTLAVLDKNRKDRLLRKYLMGDQFTKLERWIGGVYNWQQMAWEWGVTGEKVEFANFAGLRKEYPKQYAWHCIVLDPTVKYKWNPRSCVQQKHYICEVPAGGIGRRKKKTVDSSLQPQSQRLKQKRKGKKYRKQAGDMKEHRQNDVHPSWRKKYAHRNVNEEWAHGINIGSRPIQRKSLTDPKHVNRTRHRPDRTRGNDRARNITHTKPQGHEYGAFLGDGPSVGHPQQLADDNSLQQFQAKINDITHEEVLLKT